ncbi:MAG: hypothetical protein HGB12_08500 [Bacteroidetes bacterium]|nr:hypothetical protein [Bacteroidota bacterium]
MAIKNKDRKIKTKKVTFRLSLKQKKIIDRYCISHNLTNNKLIKSALKEYMLRHFNLPDEEYISENQLNLFDFEDDIIEQQELEEQANNDIKKKKDEPVLLENKQVEMLFRI